MRGPVRRLLLVTLALGGGCARPAPPPGRSVAEAKPLPVPGATFVGIGFLSTGARSSVAWDVSADGEVVVGTAYGAAVTWRRERGLNVLACESQQVRAAAVSGDGAVVVGRCGDHAVEWRGNGPPAVVAENGEAWAVSEDGATIVGRHGEPHRAFRSGATGQLETLGDLPGGDLLSDALAVSADGSRVVGWSRTQRSSRHGGEACIWSRTDGIRPLGGASTFVNVFPQAMTGDGRFVVGRASEPGEPQAFLWSDEGGYRGLGYLPNQRRLSAAEALSADGRVVVGRATAIDGNEAFVWTESGGMRSLHWVMQQLYRLDVEGWELTAANGVSADGETIVGYGRNPDGRTEGWVAHLPGLARRLPQLGPNPALGPVEDMVAPAGGATLAAWYRFEQTQGPIVDASGSENHGQPTPTGLVRGEPGPVGRALVVRGGYVVVPDSPTLDISRGVTVELWLRVDQLGQVGNPFSRGTGNGDDNFVLGTFCGNLQAIFSRRSPSGTTNVSTECGVLTQGEWAHVAVVNDGEEERIYVNGDVVGRNRGGQLGPIEAELRIGQRQPGLFAFAGAVDELKWWRGVRSRPEICGDAGGRWNGQACDLRAVREAMARGDQRSGAPGE